MNATAAKAAKDLLLRELCVLRSCRPMRDAIAAIVALVLLVVAASLATTLQAHRRRRQRQRDSEQALGRRIVAEIPRATTSSWSARTRRASITASIDRQGPDRRSARPDQRRPTRVVRLAPPREG